MKKQERKSAAAAAAAKIQQLQNWWAEADINRHTSQLLREQIYELQNSKMLENEQHRVPKTRMHTNTHTHTHTHRLCFMLKFFYKATKSACISYGILPTIYKRIESVCV